MGFLVWKTCRKTINQYATMPISLSFYILEVSLLGGKPVDEMNSLALLFVVVRDMHLFVLVIYYVGL